MIRTYTRDEAFDKLVRQEDGSENYAPGDLVGWLRDSKATGTIIGVNEDEWHRLVEVAVLWSRAPVEVKITTQHIKASSRKLKTKWSSEGADDLKAVDALDAGIKPMTFDPNAKFSWSHIKTRPEDL